MPNLNKILLLTFLIAALQISASPIANIEDVRRSNEVGSFRDIEFAFSGTRGNEERDDYDIGIALVKNSLFIPIGVDMKILPFSFRDLLSSFNVLIGSSRCSITSTR